MYICASLLRRTILYGTSFELTVGFSQDIDQANHVVATSTATTFLLMGGKCQPDECGRLPLNIKMRRIPHCEHMKIFM
jgi:hypothetical protein